MRVFLALFLCSLLVTLTGCSVTPAQKAAALKQSTSFAVSTGLTQLDKRNHQAAQDAANAVKQIVGNDILPYLNGDSTHISSSTINLLLSQKFVKLDPSIKTAISLAAGALDMFLPPPAANTYLNATQVAYLKAFFEGLNDGSVNYLSNAPTRAVQKTSTKTGKWLSKL